VNQEAVTEKGLELENREARMNISKVAHMVCTGLFGVIFFISPASSADWYADPVNPLWEWPHRQKIVINPDGTLVPSRQNDFPVLVKITDPANPIFGTARPDGDDILFTLGDKITKIPHELTLFRDTVQEEMVAWVRIETLGTGPTTIYMYYGCAGASSQENAAGVWDTGFKMVTHLNETAGGSGAVKDSTCNSNHATNGGSYPQPPIFGAPGSLGNGVQFHGGGMWASYGGHISAPHNSSLDITGPFTVEAWIKAKGSDNYLMIVDKYYGNSTKSYGFTFYMVGGAQGKGRIRLSTYGGSVHDNLVGGRTDLQTDTWHHVAGVFDGANMHLYVDGVLDTTKASVLSPASTADGLSIGKRTCGWGGYSPFMGTIDEVRLSDTGRSADWIRTCYENQSSPATFLAFFPEEEGVPFEVAVGVISWDEIEVTGAPFEGAQMTILVDSDSDSGEPVFFQGGCAGGGQSRPGGFAAWLFFGIAWLVLLCRIRKVPSTRLRPHSSRC